MLDQSKYFKLQIGLFKTVVFNREEGITFNDTWLETTNVSLFNDVVSENEDQSQSRKHDTSVSSENETVVKMK